MTWFSLQKIGSASTAAAPADPALDQPAVLGPIGVGPTRLRRLLRRLGVRIGRRGLPDAGLLGRRLRCLALGGRFGLRKALGLLLRCRGGRCVGNGRLRCVVADRRRVVARRLLTGTATSTVTGSRRRRLLPAGLGGGRRRRRRGGLRLLPGSAGRAPHLVGRLGRRRGAVRGLLVRLPAVAGTVRPGLRAVDVRRLRLVALLGHHEQRDQVEHDRDPREQGDQHREDPDQVDVHVQVLRHSGADTSDELVARIAHQATRLGWVRGAHESASLVGGCADDEVGGSVAGPGHRQAGDPHDDQADRDRQLEDVPVQHAGRRRTTATPARQPVSSSPKIRATVSRRLIASPPPCPGRRRCRG